MATTDIDLVPLIQQAIADTGRTLAGIRPAQWHDPTPCTDWDVAEVAAHLVSGLDAFGAIGEGLPMPTEDPPLDWASAAAAYVEASSRALGAWTAPGALDHVYHPPWGDSPGRMLAGFLIIETVVHGWDLAKATGQPCDYDAATVEAAYEMAVATDDPSIRVDGMFGPVVDVADDAPLIDRLAGFLGRAQG